jgi:hypothetical protein
VSVLEKRTQTQRKSVLRGFFDRVGSARTAASKTRSSNNLKQIGLALHNYHDTYKRFPPAYTTDDEGKPLLSWRVLILPFAEEEDLYKQFHLDEPWDSPHNRQLVDFMPDLFRSPEMAEDGLDTSYVAIVGEGAVFTGPKPTPIADIRDGTSNTLMVVESRPRVFSPWTMPKDITYDPAKPAEGLGAFYSDGFHALLADGSVRFLPYDIAEETLRRLITRSDGNTVPRF